MNTSFRRAVATATVCAAGLAGALVTVTPADAASPQPSRASGPVKTDVGYKATALASKVYVDGVQLRNARTAYAEQTCTRYAGRTDLAGNTLDELQLPLVSGGLSTSRTQTYVKDGVRGVRAVSTIADLALGGELQGMQTPTLELRGLTSTAHSFRRADGTFGHEEDFEIASLGIGNLPAQIPQELQDLLDVLGQTTGDLATEIITLLTSVTGNEIEIPGLGSIGLAGVKNGGSRQDSAWSQTHALRLTVTATENPTELILGRARALVSAPVHAGVFRSFMTGIELLGGLDTMRLGGVGEQTIPCSGTHGKVRRHSIGSTSVLGGLLELTGVEYAYLGDQSTSGAARGFASSSIGRLEVPSIGLVIDGITAKVIGRKAADQTKVDQVVKTGIASITLGGQPIEVPTFAGQTVDLGEHGFLEYRLFRNRNRRGVEVRALALTLPGVIPGGSVIDLGWAGLHIAPN